MSFSDNDRAEQVQFSSERAVVTDKSPSAYNAETEVNENYQIGNIKVEHKPCLKCKLSRYVIKNKRLYTFLIKMYHIVKELVIMFFLALTYAALTNNPPKISKGPPAVPFFPESSVVEDWYRGELTAALTKAKQFDIAFIMFYAPWNAECQTVRHEFDIAARYMQKDVTFLAVNCWQPGSECRNQYSKAYTWPILIAYLSNGKGIHYRGIYSAPYMIKFLISLARPLIRIYEHSEIDELLALNDAVVVGCLNAFTGSSAYSTLYSVSIKVLEREPNHGFAFAVLTGVNNSCIDGIDDHVLSLHLWNERLLYPNEGKWNSEAIATWIQQNIQQVTAWAMPSGKKSTVLSTYLQPGPTLILFTPKNPLAISEDYYNLLQEIAVEYYNCEEDNGIKLSSVFSLKLRIENYLKYKKELKKCGIKEEINKGQSSMPSTVSFTVSKKWANSTYCDSQISCSKCDLLKTLDDRIPSHCKQDCSGSYQYQQHANSNIYKSCDAVVENKLRTIIDDELDHRLPLNLQKKWEEQKCRKAEFAQNIYYNVFSQTIRDIVESEGNINFIDSRGLACKTNTTLKFIAFDSLQHYLFAERLGIDLSKKKDRTAAVIVNDKMETHHIMQEAVNDETLRQFVVNFTAGDVARAFNSELNIKPTHTHAYSPKKACSTKGSSEFCLTELNSETFLPTVLQQGQVVIVFYYSKQCSFCSGISYTFLTVAKMFSSVSVMKFVRIDGDLNTLPWEFTMERYPTILLFPFRKKAETRVFPQEMPITVSNILNFIFSNLNPTLKLHAMWNICNQTKLEDDRLLCIASIRAENLSLIDRTLRVWRNATALMKAKLLHKLQHLRNINLLLALYPQNNDDINRYLSQLQWSVDEHVHIKTVNSRKKHGKDEL